MHIVSVCCIFMLYIKSRWVTALLAANTNPTTFECEYKKCRKYLLLILALQDKKDMADGKVTKDSQGFYVTDCP